MAVGGDHSIRVVQKAVRQTQNSLCGAEIQTETFIAERSRQTGIDVPIP